MKKLNAFEVWKVPLSFCILALSFKHYVYIAEADPLSFKNDTFVHQNS